ncbi:MAG: hypothetical protein KAR06_03005 [Deltaproteobacteria bacterium]|nr:hypothetical protein [Deltaproteobacteria bacterium]
MAEKNAGKAGVVIGTAAAIAAAVALLQKRTAQGAPGNGGNGVVGLDEATMQLLLAIAQSADNAGQDLSALLQAIDRLALRTQGWVPNADEIVAGRMNVQALNTARQLPHLEIPDDMEIQLKGWPTNAGLIYVASTDPAARNINSVWPLLPNEAIGYRIKNLNSIYFSGNAVGDWVVWTVEYRR